MLFPLRLGSLRGAFRNAFRDYLASPELFEYRAASGAYSLSRCRVDFDPATKIPINRLSPTSPDRGAAAPDERRTGARAAYYTCTPRCSLEFPQVVFTRTPFPGKFPAYPNRSMARKQNVIVPSLHLVDREVTINY